MSDRRLEAAQLPFNGLPQVLQQMKAIRDLSRLRGALTRGIRIETRAITADNFDFRMPPEPVTLCASMIAAVGLASRKACSRHLI